MARYDRRRARRAAGALLLALPLLAALCGPARAGDEPGSSPPPIISVPAPSTSARQTTPTPSAPRTTSSPTSASSTHRVPSSATHRYRSSTHYRAPSTASASSDTSSSEPPTGAPTQTFVLGSASLGSVSSSTPAVTASPTPASSSDDSTDDYVHVFFAVIVAAALLLAAGITGLVLTRDGRYSGGRHR